MIRLITLMFALSLSAPSLALADTPIEIVPLKSGVPSKSTTVATGGANISTDAFVAAIMDGDHYPMSASYMGVDALEECRTLERRADGSVIVYQRTGGGLGVSSRQYVIQLKVKQKTETYAEIEWNLVKHTQSGSTWTGPFASALNAHSDAVWTPVNYGTWRYDRTRGTITYSVQSDPGGSVPDWLVSEKAVMAFPLELLKVKWGVTPK